MQKEGMLVPLSRKFYPSLPESWCLGFGLSKGALNKTAGHLPGHSSMHCFPRPTMPLRPSALGSQPLLALPIPCSLQVPCTDMGSCTRAHCMAGALDFTRLLCAVLGIVVIMVVPSIINLQVHKSVCMDSSSLSFGIWKEIPVPLYISIYSFDKPRRFFRARSHCCGSAGSMYV